MANLLSYFIVMFPIGWSKKIHSFGSPWWMTQLATFGSSG